MGLSKPSSRITAATSWCLLRTRHSQSAYPEITVMPVSGHISFVRQYERNFYERHYKEKHRRNRQEGQGIHD
jgi:hypothetical protein